jgi:hypothetical protein
MIMTQPDNWLRELEAEHGEWITYTDGSYTIRLFEDGFALQKDNDGTEWPTAGWEGPHTSVAKNRAFKFLTIHLEQTTAALKDAREALSGAIYQYIEHGTPVDDLEGRKAHLRRLYDEYRRAFEAYELRVLKPQAERRRQEEILAERRQVEAAHRSAEMAEILTALREDYRVEELPSKS